jgi:hypothetical protein
MTISFKYKTVQRPDSTPVKTPSIPITLIGPDEKIDTIGLLDSGADISAISKDMAELLGLDLSGKKEKSFGIGGKVDSVSSKVRLTIEKGHEKYNFTVPVIVVLDNYDFPVLLGRRGIFQKFVISFDEKQEKVSLKRTTRRTY